MNNKEEFERAVNKAKSYKDVEEKRLRVLQKYRRDFCILLINSSIFYLYWSTYGNLRGFTPNLLYKFPIPEYMLK